MSHLNIAFDRYASIGTVMHYILLISVPISNLVAAIAKFRRFVTLLSIILLFLVMLSLQYSFPCAGGY